ncbi:MAG: B12-binding domain-containing radical SAM protein [Ardenticatenaceae bacterium]|nr:B12-binding domain-containing radical SAM protein [Ardenticatenaceae bacterium]
MTAGKPKTTFIYAGIAGKGFNSLKQGMDSGWISHGLASLSAYIKNEGFEADLIDLRALRGWEHFREVLEQRNPDVVGLSMMSVDFNPVMEAVSIAKEVNPNIVTVVGGPHPTAEPDEVLENPLVDYIVQAEGEITFANLLKSIEGGSLPQNRKLLGIHPNLNTIPYADRDLFLNEWRKWGYDLVSPEVPFVKELPAPFVTIIAGRGCRYKCNFCKPMEDFLFGKGTRRRSVDNVMAELVLLRDRYGFASFMFHDDCLTEDRDWVIEFCEKYAAAGFTQPFFCQSRADILYHHEDMVALMASVGLKGYFIGFESGNNRVLNFIRKGTTREKNIAAAEICRKYGLTIWANYMLGLPTETKEEVMDTVSMLKIIDPDYYSPSFYTPHPGSDLYVYGIEHDLNLVMDHDSYRRNPTEAKIKGLPLEFLMWARDESQKRTFKNAARRSVRSVWEKYGDPHKYLRKFKKLAGLDGGGGGISTGGPGSTGKSDRRELKQMSTGD